MTDNVDGEGAGHGGGEKAGRKWPFAVFAARVCGDGLMW